MRISQVDVVIHPGLGGGSQDHWYAGWLRKLKTGKRVEQDNWDQPQKEVWVEQFVRTVDETERPVVVIAHSLGVISAVHAAPNFKANHVKGAFLVAPPDPKCFDDTLPECESFGPVPTDPLPFPSMLIASRNDPYCPYEVAEDFSYAWGSRLLDAGEAGHLNPESGHGPWPEGLLRLASFLNGLS